MFPLTVQSGKRHLVNASGNPFLVHGDSPWSLIANLSREDAVLYLDDRQARGFTTILVNLLEHKFSASPPRNFYGDAPFTTAGDFSTPNNAYFNHADYVLARAQERGFLVLLAPAYLGVGGGDEGWYSEMTSSGTTKLTTYGRFIGTRYSVFSNILWVNGGDYRPPNKALTRAVAEGIRATNATALQTAHCDRNNPALDYWRGETWLKVNTSYTGTDTATQAIAQYQQPEQMPFFLIEAYYENENSVTLAGLRTQAYVTMFSGGCGHMFGNSPIWHFDSLGASNGGWKANLNSAGARSMTVLKGLFDTIRWDLLAPDISNTFLTAGAQSGSNKAAAALASDQSFGAIYTPNARTLTVDLSRLSGPNVRARWFDVSNGAFTTISGSPFANNQSRNFVTPGNNAGGQGDWVLLLESVP